MILVYQGQEFILDPKKIDQKGQSFTYRDVFLCNDSNLIEVEYQDLIVMVTTKQFHPFQKVHCPSKRVKPQLITSNQAAHIGFLNSVYSKLSTKSNNLVSLDVYEQFVLGFPNLGNVNISYPRDKIIEKLSNSIQPFIQ